jgi:hypothetical protein
MAQLKAFFINHIKQSVTLFVPSTISGGKKSKKKGAGRMIITIG